MTNSNAELHERGIEAAYGVAKDYLAEVTSREQQMVRCCIRAYLAIAPQARRPTYEQIINLVERCRVRRDMAGESTRMMAKWISEGLNLLCEAIAPQAPASAVPVASPPAPVDVDAIIERCAHVADERSAELSLKAQDVRYGDSDRRYYSASAYDMQFLSHDILALKSSPPAQADDGKAALIDDWGEPTEQQINSACMSYRHNFGLLPKLDQEALRRQAKFWLEAWQKEFASPPPPAKADEDKDAEIERLTRINSDHCRSVNTLLLDGSRLEDRTIKAEAMILELVAALDRIAKGDPYHWCNSRAEVALAKAKAAGYEP